VGGLADMVASLSRALARRGHDVRVLLPLYGDIDRQRHSVRRLERLPAWPIRVGQTWRAARLHVKGSGSSAVKVYLVENPELFGRPGVYTDPAGGVFPDALARAVLHAQAALGLPLLLDWIPDVIHVHDAATALVPVYHRRWAAGHPELAKGGTLLTIHNLAHQMELPAGGLAEIGLPAALGVYPGPLEYHGRLNVLKAGIIDAGRVNTVSPTYAREVVADEDFGCGLDGVLRARGAHFSGILNGADLDEWNPARDRHLPTRYTLEQPAGRRVCRQALLAELGLSDGESPLAGFVGRLVEQKGIDILLPVLDGLLADGWRLALLATGDPAYREPLAAAAARHRGRLAFLERFDEGLAHRFYAGCDLFLMPSRFEPCGLAQMYALRYGAVPVVRRTGGLADTVVDAERPDGTGFVFDAYRPDALRSALARARRSWSDAPFWTNLVRRGMQVRFSWEASAMAYERLYDALAARGGARHDGSG
jgi:starch synthase